MNIVTIIPVHEFNDEVKDYLHNALASITTQQRIDESVDVLVVYAAALDNNKDFVEFQKAFFDKVNLKYLANNGNTDFQSQINFGVENIDTDWFSILEFDDVLSKRYYYHVLHHIDKIGHIAGMFLPLLAEVNNDDALIKLTNETVWSRQFVGENGELGYLNAPALNQYTDFKISGGIFKTADFKAAGCLKSNIKLTFTYEFLLRMLNNGCNIYSIPKIGVKHLATREGSLFDNYGKTMSIQERKFWFDTAKKESNFFNDRVIDTSLLEKSVAE